MNFIYDYLEKDDIFIDVGANIGAHSLMAASKIKTGKIFSFEPSLKALKYLKENIQINNLTKVITVIDKVVSNKTGYEKFIMGKHSEVDHIGGWNNLSQDTNIIPSITLDKFFKIQKISYVDLVKIDVEGAELKVLEGLKDYLARGKVGAIIFEINSNCVTYGYNSEDIVKFLKQNRFAIFLLGDNYKLNKLTINNLRSLHTFNALAVHKSKTVQDRIVKYLKKTI
jgi:FkbM family methyltransferase